MTMPTEDELREFVRKGLSDAMVAQQVGATQSQIMRLRKTFGITASNPQYCNGVFAVFEREIKGLIDKDAERKLALYRFEDSPIAVRAQSGYGRLPPRAEYGLQGGSFAMVLR